MNKVLHFLLPHRHYIACMLYILISSQLVIIKSSESNNNETSGFQVDNEWRYINYTWLSKEHYRNAIISQEYVPENVSMTGIKIWKENLYIAMPKIRHGVPATLGWISLKDSPKVNPLISPFPSWNWHGNSSDCAQVQSVQSMEIDRNGVMWVLDGFRIYKNNKCPPKLLLFNLEDGKNQLLHSFTFSDRLCLTEGGFLNDLVLDSDEEDGDFAYITDASAVDPGLIVYSRKKNSAWKFRDSSMFTERNASSVVVDGDSYSDLSPIDGIALSPQSFKKDKSVYYCTLVGNYLFSIKTSVLKNLSVLMKNGNWRREVKLVGRKQGPSDGMAVDNKGNLYYGILPLYAVAKWNINDNFDGLTARIIAKDEKNMKWPDSFTFDNKGNLFLLIDNINKYFDLNYHVKINNETKFKILKYYTGTKSYLF